MKLPFWGTILTIIGFIVLCTLGTWQLERLAWKQDLIAKLDAAYGGGEAATLDMKTDFSYGRIGGRLLTDKALLIGPRVQNKEVGQDLIVPLALKDQILLVNMGWTDEVDISALPIHHANKDDVYFTGLLRKPTWNGFTPDNAPEDNVWYKLDPQEIAGVKNLENISPFVLYAERASYKFDGKFPNTERQYPNNNHMQYAFFWFSMALAMIAVYVLRFIKR